MATATKTWVFASDAEGLSQQVGGGQAPTFAFQSGDGNAAGCAEFAQGSKSQTNAVCEAYNGATGDTFSSLFSVGAGSDISAIRVTGFDDRVSSNTKLSSHSVQVQVIDDAGSAIATLCTINPGTATGSFANVGAQTSQSISKAGSDGCRLKLVYTCTTSGGGGSANVVYRMDNIALEITYTAGATTFQQSMSASAVGAALTGKASTFSRAFSANAVGSAVVARAVTYLRGFAATVSGVSSLASASVIGKALSATVTGVSALSEKIVVVVGMSANVAGSAVVNTAVVIVQALAAGVSGISSLATEFTEGAGAVSKKFARGVLAGLGRLMGR